MMPKPVNAVMAVFGSAHISAVKIKVSMTAELIMVKKGRMLPQMTELLLLRMPSMTTLLLRLRCTA